MTLYTNTINRWESLHAANGIMVDPVESFGPSLNGLVQPATCRMLNEWTHKKPIGTGNNLNDSFSLLVCICLCLSCNSYSISGFSFFSRDEDNGCKDLGSTAPKPSGCSRSNRSILQQRCLFCQFCLSFCFLCFSLLQRITLLTLYQLQMYRLDQISGQNLLCEKFNLYWIYYSSNFSI